MMKDVHHLPAGYQFLRSDEPVGLKRADADPLRVFAANSGEALSRHALSERLAGGSRRAINVQIARLRRKIEPEPQIPRYLQTVCVRGYVLRAD